MIALDVNILVTAHKEQMPQHAASKAWLDDALAGSESLGLPDETVCGFLRLATNLRVFTEVAPDAALAFCEALRASSLIVPLRPGEAHWRIFSGLVRTHRLRATDIPDAHLAALCLERGATLATFDRGFARFEGLRTVTPAAS